MPEPRMRVIKTQGLISYTLIQPSPHEEREFMESTVPLWYLYQKGSALNCPVFCRVVSSPCRVRAHFSAVRNQMAKIPLPKSF